MHGEGGAFSSYSGRGAADASAAFSLRRGTEAQKHRKPLVSPAEADALS
jgi:hypothetical protein